MINGLKVVVVMPAYNSSKTLLLTYNEVILQEIVDQIIIVDDCSNDDTIEIASKLEKVIFFKHKINKGYGGNQKTCYRIAIENKADIIIMVHPDYQYTPQLIPLMASKIANGISYVVLGSRILDGNALKNGMPKWRFIANKFLTFISNHLYKMKLSEYHTGYRAFSKEVFSKINLRIFSNNFLFDYQFLSQIIWFNYSISEISCPARYLHEASSINFIDSIKYGIGCLLTTFLFLLCKKNIIENDLFPKINISSN